MDQMHQANSIDLCGPEEVLTHFTASTVEWQKERSSKVVGIPTHIKNLDEATNGLQEGRVIGVGGKPNHGKSAFVLSIAHSVATKNDNVIVIIHSTDDNREVVFSRLMAIDQDLDINTVTNPRAYLKLREPIIRDGKTIHWNEAGTKAWTRAKDNITKLISDGRIVIKDSTHGATLAFTENMIKYYSERNPDKRILVIFDNFHKAQDFLQFEERIRFKKMSHQAKYLAEKYHVAFLATMEYTKLGSGTRPENSNLAETVQMEYDLSMILHVYNELKDVGIDKAKLVTIIEDGAESKSIPIVDVMVGKNKQTAFQDRLYYNFYPAKGKFLETTKDAATAALNRGNDRRLEGLR
jgi:replicative DNA helicase